MEGKIHLEDFSEPAKSVNNASDSLQSKKELMTIHKNLQKLSVDHMKELKKRPVQELQQHLDIIIHVLGDKLFMATGVENEDLDLATENLNLEEDPAYKQLELEYAQ